MILIWYSLKIKLKDIKAYKILLKLKGNTYDFWSDPKIIMPILIMHTFKS